MDSSEWPKLVESDPEFDAAYEKASAENPFINMRDVTPAEGRDLIKMMVPPAPDPPVAIEEKITVPARDGYAIPVVVYKPLNPTSQGSPVAVMLHGGGWVVGPPELEATNCRNFASELGIVCFNVDYRLAPEYPFPTAINDCWDVVEWVTTNAKQFGGDPSKGFISAGMSAGGNMADVVAHLARDKKLSPPITGVIEMVPAIVPPSQIPERFKGECNSYSQNSTAPILDADEMEYFFNQYKPDVKSELCTSFNSPNGHAGLPPVVIQVCGLDPLRDEALMYERLLRKEAGVKTKLHVYPGKPHGFHLVFPQLSAAKAFYDDTLAGAKWILDGAN